MRGQRKTWCFSCFSSKWLQLSQAPMADFLSPQNWFRTSADSPPKHRSQESLVPKKEVKSLAGVKKRGRRPKERLSEEPAPKMAPHQEDWPPGGRDKGARDSAGRKVGASKSPEK